MAYYVNDSAICPHSLEHFNDRKDKLDGVSHLCFTQTNYTETRFHYTERSCKCLLTTFYFY